MSEDKISFASYTLSGLFCDLQARHPEILDELANEFKDSFALLPCGTTQSEKTYFAERFGTRCDKAVAEIQTDPNFPIPPIMAALCRQKFMSYYTRQSLVLTHKREDGTVDYRLITAKGAVSQHKRLDTSIRRRHIESDRVFSVDLASHAFPSDIIKSYTLTPKGMIRPKRTIFIQVKGLPQGYGPFADELADVAFIDPRSDACPVFERAGMPIEFIGDEMRIYLDEEILQFIHRNTNDQLRIRFSIRVSDFYFLYLPIPSSFDVTVEGGLFDTYGFHTVSEIENPPFPVEVSLKEMIDTVISVTDFERHWDRAARLYFGGSATISFVDPDDVAHPVLVQEDLLAEAQADGLHVHLNNAIVGFLKNHQNDRIWLQIAFGDNPYGSAFILFRVSRSGENLTGGHFFYSEQLWDIEQPPRVCLVSRRLAKKLFTIYPLLPPYGSPDELILAMSSP